MLTDSRIRNFSKNSVLENASEKVHVWIFETILLDSNIQMMHRCQLATAWEPDQNHDIQHLVFLFTRGWKSFPRQMPVQLRWVSERAWILGWSLEWDTWVRQTGHLAHPRFLEKLTKVASIIYHLRRISIWVQSTVLRNWVQTKEIILFSRFQRFLTISYFRLDLITYLYVGIWRWNTIPEYDYNPVKHHTSIILFSVKWLELALLM